MFAFRVINYRISWFQYATILTSINLSKRLPRHTTKKQSQETDEQRTRNWAERIIPSSSENLSESIDENIQVISCSILLRPRGTRRSVVRRSFKLLLSCRPVPPLGIWSNNGEWPSRPIIQRASQTVHEKREWCFSSSLSSLWHRGEFAPRTFSYLVSRQKGNTMRHGGTTSV